LPTHRSSKANFFVQLAESDVRCAEYCQQRIVFLIAYQSSFSFVFFAVNFVSTGIKAKISIAAIAPAKKIPGAGMY
jgi:hypothetical protein